MKLTLIVLVLLLFFKTGTTQTYLKVADKAEFQKFMDYCNTPVSRTFYMSGAVSLLKYNGYYMQPVTGDWMAKYPLVIKWYPIGASPVTIDTYQNEITATFTVKVPRIYCKSVAEYTNFFYKYWKNGDIQSGWADEHFIGFWDFFGVYATRSN